MSSHLVMLDSGAFSVWNNGDSIDFQKYLSFCEHHPGISYYVNLDVIPGKPNRPDLLTPKEIQKACKAGWENYLAMTSVLPKDKVIPVFHMNDSHDWLEKYIEDGASYIGISPANDARPEEKLAWLRSLVPILFPHGDRFGECVVKTHGFAVTSYDLMKFWRWHSVDSASWGMWSTYGQLAIPRTKNGRPDFTLEPYLVDVSLREKPKSGLDAESYGMAGFGLEVGGSEHNRRRLLDYLAECGVTYGSYERVQKTPGSKLDEGELWLDKKRGVAYRVLEKGVSTDFLCRQHVNWRIYPNAEKVLPVDHIYYAGHFGLRGPIEKLLNKRLLTYALMGQSRMRKVLDKHTRRAELCRA